MCDQSEEMPGDGEEPALPSATGGGGEEARMSSGQQDGGGQSERPKGGESGVSGGEVGQEDDEMTSGSHDLSSSANHSPGSVTGSTSASTKRYLPDCVCPDYLAYIHIIHSDQVDVMSLHSSQNKF